MTNETKILVTSAAGQVGSVGRSIVGILLEQGFSVRAFVRTDDARAESLRDMGAEVFVGDLLDPRDVKHAVA